MRCERLFGDRSDARTVCGPGDTPPSGICCTPRRFEAEATATADAAVVWLALGTQAPDLVDKPLAWTAGVLPTGRSLAHALPIVVPLLAVGYALARRRGRGEWAFAFSLGYLAHVLADALPSLVWGDPAYARFLLWPLLTLPPYEESTSFLAHLTSIEPTGYLAAQFAMTAIAAAGWWRDGLPGLDVLAAAWRRLGAAVS